MPGVAAMCKLAFTCVSPAFSGIEMRGKAGIKPQALMNRAHTDKKMMFFIDCKIKCFVPKFEDKLFTYENEKIR
jgi:hypothetical protein